MSKSIKCFAIKLDEIIQYKRRKKQIIFKILVIFGIHTKYTMCIVGSLI